MSRNIFPTELMAKFYDGNATAEETMMILHAAEKDPELKKEIEFMTSFPEELMEDHSEKGEGKTVKMYSLPREEYPAMAAESLDEN